MNVSERLHRLEAALQKLILDWERFFAGELRVPPVAERDALKRQLRLLAEAGVSRPGDQFRLEQLQHRAMSYVQLWERQLREREEGRPRATRRGAAAPPPNAAAGGAVDSAEEASLFDRYVAARRSVGNEVRLDRAAFEGQIERQRQQIEAKLGRKVRFEVVVDGEAVKLTARPVREG